METQEDSIDHGFNKPFKLLKLISLDFLAPKNQCYDSAPEQCEQILPIMIPKEMQYTMIFPLNDSEKIISESEESLDKIHCCTNGSLTLINEYEKILLSKESTHENIFILCGQFNKALNNKLVLHPSITRDIGYLFNEELQE